MGEAEVPHLLQGIEGLLISLFVEVLLDKLENLLVVHPYFSMVGVLSINEPTNLFFMSVVEYFEKKNLKKGHACIWGPWATLGLYHKVLLP
jgi:hypothetical protein